MTESSWADALCKVVDERDALKSQLATIRNDALREALAVSQEFQSAEWRGSQRTAALNISRAILALIKETGL